MKKTAILLMLLAFVPLRAKAFSTDDLLSLVAMPLAVDAVSRVSGVPADQLANLVATLNQANVPPVQFVEVLRYVPVALVVDNGQPFVQFVQSQVAQGVTGPALVPVVVQQIQTYYPAAAQITVAAPAPVQTIVIDQNFIPPMVRKRVIEVQMNPHGGPPGQIKKQLGLQTGAEVVHGRKPGRQFIPAPIPQPMISSSPAPPKHEEHGHGRGHGEDESGVFTQPAAPAPAATPANPAGKVPPGQEKKGGKHGKD